MKILKGVTFLLSLSLLWVIFTPIATASDWDKKTVVSFEDQVQIPGQILAPGTYVFKLAVSDANRHIVQVWNEDESQLIATIQTTPIIRGNLPSNSVFKLVEGPDDSTLTLKAWFYPGTGIGQEFNYPSSSYLGQ
jgi:hypothetical protein